MKREDFEELVRLLRAWLEIAKDEEDRLRNPESFEASGKTPQERWLEVREQLRRWSNAHSQEAFQAASDSVLLRTGRHLADDLGSITSLIPAYDGNRFSTAIEAITFAAGLLLSSCNELQVGFTYEDGVCVPGLGSLHGIKERFPWFIKRLGDELESLSETEQAASDLELAKRPRGRGKGSILRDTQEKDFAFLLGERKINLDMSFTEIIQAAEKAWPGQIRFRESTVKKILKAARKKEGL